MSGFLTITVLLAAPLLLAAAGELLLERAGSIQIGVEGTMLLGAFTAFAASAEGRRAGTGRSAPRSSRASSRAARSRSSRSRGAPIPSSWGPPGTSSGFGATAFGYRLLAGATGSVLEIATLPPLLFGLPGRGSLRVPRFRRSSKSS